MKKPQKIVSMLLISFLFIFLDIHFENHVFGRVVEIDQKPVPPYAKWGQLAMKETKSKYPKANIVDYLHVGRIENPTVTTETFKLWLKEGNREFGVFVTFEFDTATEKVRNITFRETNR
jgi:hypothetical protein